MKANSAKEIKSLLDLQPDQENIHQPTKRSYNELYDSQEYCGWGRDIVIDKNGNIIAGNTSNQVAVDRTEGDAPEPIVVQSDGTRPIIHQRIDLDLYSESDDRGRALSYYDNATTHHAEWNRTTVKLAVERGRNLTRVFTDEELDNLMHDDRNLQREDEPSIGAKIYSLSVICKDEDDLSELASTLMEQGYSVKPVVRSL